MQQITENHKTEKHNSHQTFYGGIINAEDFDTNSPNKKRISNQIDASNLKQCLKTLYYMPSKG